MGRPRPAGDATGAGSGSSAYGGGRSTAQRRALSLAAEKMGAAFTVEDLVESVSRDGSGPSLATGYRAVRAMCESGFLERIGERDGRALYARCGAEGHHHHVVCTSCGAVAETSCPLAPGVSGSAARAGFVLTGHDVVLYGLCGTCAAPTGS